MTIDHHPRATEPGETLFATELWFSHWLAAFGGAGAGTWRASEVDGPAISYVLESHRAVPFRLRVARAASNAHTPRFDAFGAQPPTVEALRDMMRSLGVVALIFPYLSGASRLARTIRAAGRGLRWHCEPCEAAPYVDCTGDWQAYLAGRKKSHRANWLSDERRAIAAGTEFEVRSAWDDVAPVFDELLRVEASGWKGRAGSAMLHDAAVRGFYEALCRDLAPRGKLRVFLYRRDGRIGAFQICAVHAGVLSSLKIGFLEDYAKESPGQVLQLWTLKWAFAQPDVRIFDMLGPATESKLRWATGVEDLVTLYVFRPTLGGAVALARWKIGPRLKEHLKRWSASGRADAAKASAPPAGVSP